MAELKTYKLTPSNLYGTENDYQHKLTGGWMVTLVHLLRRNFRLPPRPSAIWVVFHDSPGPEREKFLVKYDEYQWLLLSQERRYVKIHHWIFRRFLRLHHGKHIYLEVKYLE